MDLERAVLLAMKGLEWAFGSTIHYFRWSGEGKHGFSSVPTDEFQVAFNFIRN